MPGDKDAGGLIPNNNHEAENPGLGASPEFIEKWLENQNKQVEAKARETELQFQQDDHAFEFGKLSLEAQSKDRVDERANGRKSQRDRLIFVLVVILVIAILVAAALFLGKDVVALELVKAVLFITAGAAGGYGYGRTKGRQDGDSPPSAPP